MNDLIILVERLNKIKPNNRVFLGPCGFNVLDHHKPVPPPKVEFVGGSVKKSKKPFRQYRKVVQYLTELVAHLLPNIDLRGFRNHHIDHKISIWFGFHNNLPPEQIADVSNLRVIPYKENMRKGIKSIFS